MAMDYRSPGMQRVASPSESTRFNLYSDVPTSLHRANKRTFDIAFLMAPDENLLQRQNERLLSYSTVMREGEDDILGNLHGSMKKLTKNLSIQQCETNVKKLFAGVPADPPGILSEVKTSPRITPEPVTLNHAHIESRKAVSSQNDIDHPKSIMDRCISLSEPVGLTCGTYCEDRQNKSKSAFTKVFSTPSRIHFDDGETSPRSSLPSDLTHRSSRLSPTNISSNTGDFMYTFPPSKIIYPFVPNAEQINCPESPRISQSIEMPNSKLTRFQQEPAQTLTCNPITIFPRITDALTRPRFIGTAANITGLLPTSLAALSLPAQNVCAKCNLSFRMTSDLVYHMRSHHKNESVGEAARRRREEKLRCPVCDESFRERHHLTRHMTAHQDKESDTIVHQSDSRKKTLFKK